MKKVLLVGLGNPGRKFERTRHNLGVRVVRAWHSAKQQESSEASDWKDIVSLEAEIAELSLPDLLAICCFPLTHMNTSGRAVLATLNKYSIEVDDIVVVHDELELSFGDVVVQKGGSAKGHNGIRSIYELLGGEVGTRVRVGIGRPPEGVPANQYVLSPLSSEEERILQEKIIPQGQTTISDILQG